MGYIAGRTYDQGRGLRLRRVQLIVHDFNLSERHRCLFESQQLSNGQAQYACRVPESYRRSKCGKLEYFGYIQDEWKVSPTFTANIGLRYEFFNAFSEIHNRDIPFDVQGCGGYCPVGSAFAKSAATESRTAAKFRMVPRIHSWVDP